MRVSESGGRKGFKAPMVKLTTRVKLDQICVGIDQISTSINPYWPIQHEFQLYQLIYHPYWSIPNPFLCTAQNRLVCVPINILVSWRTNTYYLFCTVSSDTSNIGFEYISSLLIKSKKSIISDIQGIKQDATLG